MFSDNFPLDTNMCIVVAVATGFVDVIMFDYGIPKNFRDKKIAKRHAEVLREKG